MKDYNMTKPGKLILLSVIFLASSVMNFARAQEFDYSDYAYVLNNFVDEHGMVVYQSLKAHRGSLDGFVESLGSLDRSTFDAWSDDAQIAFLVNAYNAITLQRIINHYPIEPTFPNKLIHPDNSIRQIKGVFDGIETEVLGEPMTLDHIEHEILRKEYNEPRIHLALVCAALSCPELRQEPYTGSKLESQLNDQTDEFVRKSDKFRIDRQSDVVYVSSIFDWFGQDFVPDYGGNPDFQHLNEKKGAVVHFISRYVDENDRNYLQNAEYQVRYLDYDWTLNSQKMYRESNKEV